eukprot:GHVU01152127.1.p1 GENE.GHVU01152127.1~~GHVU01152127.1.p1  ORF type:complete len:183 (+),score=24.35 GHVU01152127.1:232-780(+)
MPIICIGPLCVPIWHLWILVLFILKPVVRRVKGFLGYEIEEASKAIPATAATATDADMEGTFKEAHSESDWKELYAHAETSKMPIVVDFSAKWCTPCAQIAPHFERLSKSYVAAFCKVDIDELPDVSESLGISIMALPAFVLMRYDEEEEKFVFVEQVVGAHTGELERMVSKHCTPQMLPRK